MSESIGNIGLNYKAHGSLMLKNIKTIKDLTNFTDVEVCLMDGIGEASFNIIEKALKKEGLFFKDCFLKR